MIKGIIFDFGGVVIYDIDYWICSTAAKYYDVSIRQIKQALKKHEKGRHKHGWDEDKYWKAVAHELKSDKPTRRIWTEKYGKIAVPHKEVMRLVRKLKSKGYKTAVLSNTCQAHVNINNRKGLYNLFDVKVFSCEPEVDSEKPAAKIYEVCLKRLGLKAKECVYIDDKKRYLPTARKLGMKVIHCKDTRLLKGQLERLGVKA